MNLKPFFLILLCFGSIGYGLPDRLDYQVRLQDLDGKAASLVPYKGKTMLILYFSVTCPHCKVVRQRVLEKMKGNSCLQAVGIITGGDMMTDILTTRPELKFPGPLFYDKDRLFKDRFDFQKVPRVVFVSADGRILSLIEDIYLDNIGELLDLNITRICGGKPFQTTMHNRYYGASVCKPCHARIDSLCQGTRHADAFLTLAKKAFKRKGFRDGDERDMNPECLKCHTTGFGERNGYSAQRDSRSMQGVQCEACHGPAGPHDGDAVIDYEARCTTCHNTLRDPLFNYERSLKRLPHPTSSK